MNKVVLTGRLTNDPYHATKAAYVGRCEICDEPILSRDDLEAYDGMCADCYFAVHENLLEEESWIVIPRRRLHEQGCFDRAFDQ